MAGPLIALLKKGGFVWSLEAKKAFSKLKGAVVKPPVLPLPNFSLQFQIKYDASGKAIGVVLMQLGYLIAFFGKALKGKTLALSTTYENELLALVIAVQKWQSYLLGSQFSLKLTISPSSFS